MTGPARPPFLPDAAGRSNAEAAEARIERVRAGVQRRAERTALQIEKGEIDCSRIEQRIILQRTRQEHPSAEMRAVNELRAQVAALAARLGIAPWPPVETPAVKTRKGDRKRGGCSQGSTIPRTSTKGRVK